MAATLAAGGSISHHHGIGRVRRRRSEGHPQPRGAAVARAWVAHVGMGSTVLSPRATPPSLERRWRCC
jgi:hypothetical protein